MRISDTGCLFVMAFSFPSYLFLMSLSNYQRRGPIRTKSPPDAKLEDVRICHPRRVLDEVAEEVLRSMNLLKGHGEFLLEPPPINERDPPERPTTQADAAESGVPDGVLIPAPGETGVSDDDSPSGVTAGAMALPVQLASTPKTHLRHL